MSRLARTAAGVYAYALFLLVVALAAAWFTVAGAVYGLVHAPGFGLLGLAAATTAFYGAHPDRIPPSIRKALP